MRILRSLVLLMAFATMAFAQGRVPATMVSVTTNGWGSLPTDTNLQGVLDYVDDHITALATTNFAPTSTTNTTVKTFTPRWDGDLLMIYGSSTQLWFSSGTTTNDWHCLYPTLRFTTNLIDSTNTLPMYYGQYMLLVNAQTNILYCATNLTIGSWRAIFRGSP